MPISTPSGFVDIRTLAADADWTDSAYPPSIGPGANAGDVSENFKFLRKLTEPADRVQDVNIFTLANHATPANVDGTSGVEHASLDLTLRNVPTMIGRQFDPAVPYLESKHEPPHPHRIPTDAESNLTRAKVLERQDQIMAIQQKIARVQAMFEVECEEAADKLRPTMDMYHSQIIAIQQRMAALWNIYSEQRQKAEREVQAVVAGFNVQIRVLELENDNAASFLAPIRRLPVEMLAEVFYWAICGNSHPPLELARVNQSWRAVVFSLPRMWSSFHFATWTKAEKIDFILERTGCAPLDVDIDTASDVLKVVDEKEVRYAGMERTLSVASRWRNLIITTFPSKVDVDAHWAPTKSPFTIDGPIDALESLKIRNHCEDSSLFEQLLDAIGNGSHERLVDMELWSPNAIYHLSQPQFTSIFRRLVTFKVDVREMRTDVDILTHFEHLEVFEAFRLRLPTYSLDTELPLVRTLKRMKIKTVSVQWMAGRTFPNLVDCTIIWPHYPETLAPGGGVHLPICTHFAYDDHIIDTLPSFRVPKLDTLTVKNEAWNKPRGSTQLAAVWKGTSGQVSPLKPRVLHLETQCHDQHLINALLMLPELEELYLGVVRPDGLGKKFFGALQAKKGKAARHASHISVLCPNLRTFGIRYRRWFRDDEADEITPMLYKIIESRRKTDAPLECLKFWSTKEMPDDSFRDLCVHPKESHLEDGSTCLDNMEGVHTHDLHVQFGQSAA